jgi:hypothetical protein
VPDGDLTDEPPVVLVGEDDDADEAEPTTPSPSGQQPGPHSGPSNGDADSVFTVVARRPRNDGGTTGQI